MSLSRCPKGFRARGLGNAHPALFFPSPGTIRTCQKFLIQYNRRQLLVLLQNCTDEGKSRWADVETEEVGGGCRLGRSPPKGLLPPFACLSPGQREAIKKSVSRSCLLQEESGEDELSDSGDEEAAEAME